VPALLQKKGPQKTTKKNRITHLPKAEEISKGQGGKREKREDAGKFLRKVVPFFSETNLVKISDTKGNGKEPGKRRRRRRDKKKK